MTAEPRLASSEASTFRSELLSSELAPFWEAVDRNPAPRPTTVPHRWRRADYAPLLRRAGTLVSTNEAERRVLMLVNPASRGEKRAVGNLYAGVQLVLPGERARAHRHTAAALRFILEGSGALTVVDGEAVELSRFDLVLTPGWAWHDHVNDTAHPMIWLDALDSPLVRALDAWFFEPHPDGMQRPSEGPAPAQTSLSYPWAPIQARLAAELAGSDRGASAVAYTDPTTHGDVLPTIRCRALAVAPGGQFGPVQRVGAAVFCVVGGSGVVTISTESFDISPADVFGIPSWYPLSIVNRSNDDLWLFSYDDEPVLRALGLAREHDLGDE